MVKNFEFNLALFTLKDLNFTFFFLQRGALRLFKIVNTVILLISVM